MIDYVYLGNIFSGAKYCLVLKNAFTHFCEHVLADTTSALVAADAILGWNAHSGTPKAFISDNCTHFRNQVFEQVIEPLGTTHRLSPVYAPWLNGGADRAHPRVANRSSNAS
ncbi:hypothetical protein CCR75_007570 [Bremia lactucae]|uniref:Integrase catalytic domain-containing protein n=1 Tax=Bremia lactucae TaxID=4779 RepID=A0A976IAW3_BRELC|nr:hypothetical protein CCR75_007570 [Bremia lactucae]